MFRTSPLHSKRHREYLGKVSILRQAIPPHREGNNKLLLRQPTHIIISIIKSAKHRGSISGLSRADVILILIDEINAELLIPPVQTTLAKAPLLKGHREPQPSAGLGSTERLISSALEIHRFHSQILTCP